MVFSLDYYWYRRKKRIARYTKLLSSSTSLSYLEFCPTPGCNGMGNKRSGRLCHRSVNYCPRVDGSVFRVKFRKRESGARRERFRFDATNPLVIDNGNKNIIWTYFINITGGGSANINVIPVCD
jgi:hypothetical protein